MDFKIEGNSVAFELEIDGTAALARMDDGEWRVTIVGGAPAQNWIWLCQGRVGIDEVIKRAIMLTKLEAVNKIVWERRCREEYGTP